MACMTDASEQVVIIERWAGHEVRSWVAAADMTVSEPLDERLVPISIFTSHVIGLGICASRDRTGTQQPAARLLDVQSIVQAASGPLAVDLGRPDPITVQLRGPEPALLYGAPAVTLPGSPASPSRPGPLADPTATGPGARDLDPRHGTPVTDRRLGDVADRLLRDRVRVPVGWPERHALAAHRPHPGGRCGRLTHADADADAHGAPRVQAQ